MACIKFTIIALFFSMNAGAQTFAEWFSQKKTQKKYLLQQIAALQVYSGYLQKGYQIAKGGLGSIGGYIGQEYGLHSSYYTQLKTVSAPVKNNPQVNQILRWQEDILQQAYRLKKQNGLNDREQVYVARVCNSLLADCDARLNDLQTVLSNNKTSMGDEERMRQIGRLHEAMQDNYRFVADFRSQLQIYVHLKTREQKDVNLLKKLYENP